MNRNDSIYLLDMSRAAPGSAICDALDEGCWTAVDYTVAAGAGRMLFATHLQDPPELRLDLPVTGWHRIHIATFRHFQFPDCLLRLKLASDPAFTRAAQEDFRADKDLVAPGMVPGATDLTEAYWKTANLRPGEQLVLSRAQVGYLKDTMANIAYVRLVPLSDAERAEIEAAEAPRDDTRRLIANYDGGQHIFWNYGSRQEMAEEFQALAASDFGTVLWGVGRTFETFYPSRVADAVDGSPMLPGVYRATWEGWQRHRAAGFDPLAAAVDCAHEVGLAIHPQMRMAGEKLPPVHLSGGGPGSFQTRNPQWRCRTVDGKPTRHLSHAFPEVRERYVALFREWVEDYGADGVNLLFNRSFPFVLHEEPVRLACRERHGLELDSCDLLDEAVLAVRAGFLTQTLRATRAMLDEVGAARGRRLGLSCLVPTEMGPEAPDLGPFTYPRVHALDVEAWVHEGLVDHLVVHIERTGDPEGTQAAESLRPYVELARGTGTRVYADLYPRRQSAESMRVRALACYGAGVDGLCFWDCQKRAHRLSGWAMHRTLGHRDELPRMQGYADSLFRLVPLTSLDGFDTVDPCCQPTDG